MKNLVKLALCLVAFTILVSSCQRGYGCPYKFQSKANAVTSVR